MLVKTNRYMKMHGETIKITKYPLTAMNISASYKTQSSRVMRPMLLSDTYTV